MINNSQLALLELIKNSLFGTKPNIPQDTDWDEVLKEAKAHTVTALAAPAVPKDVVAKWEESAAQSTANYMRAIFEQTNLIKLFEKNNIPLVIIKGMAAAMYYPKPQLRTMGDIDFLVPEEHFATAQNILENNGYSFEGDYDDGRDYTYSKGGVILELHRRFSDIYLDIEDVLIKAMKRPVPRRISGQSFPSLPDVENGLILLDHIRHHLKGGLGLRQIIDWTMFANKLLDNDTYNNEFLPLLRSTGLETFCRVVTKMCKMYLFLPKSITWCDDADTATAEQLFTLVLQSGNFGRKKPYEYKPMTAFTMDVKKNGLFKALQTAGIENFAVCKKYKIMRPFAWLFQLLRYIHSGLISLFKGEKLLTDISKGKENSDFNNRLGI